MRALFLGRGVAKLEDHRIAHVGDQLLRPFAERINLFGLVQVLHEKLLVRVILELLNLNFFDCFSAIRVLLLDCRMRYACRAKDRQDRQEPREQENKQIQASSSPEGHPEIQ